LGVILKDIDTSSKNHSLLKDFLYLSALGICFLLNLGSLYILLKTHAVFEKLKKESQEYNSFIISQGMQISFPKICNYLFNVDTIYLFAVSSLIGLQTPFYNFVDPTLTSNIPFIVVIIFSTIAGYFIVTFVNNHSSLVTMSYRAIEICLMIYLINVVLRILLVTFVNSDKNNDVSLISLINLFLEFVIKTIWLVMYSLMHELIIFLLHPRCAIRGISLSFNFLFYSLANLIGQTMN